jgi:hypothetical protein
VLTKDNLAKHNSQGIVFFIINTKQLSICSLSVVLVVLSGLLFRRLQACLNEVVSQVCLGFGI